MSGAPDDTLTGFGGLRWRRWEGGWIAYRAPFKAVASVYAPDVWTLKIKRRHRVVHVERCPDLQSMMRRGFRLLSKVDAKPTPRPLDTVRRKP